jgi:hypothetical protein
MNDTTSPIWRHVLAFADHGCRHAPSPLRAVCAGWRRRPPPPCRWVAVPPPPLRWCAAHQSAALRAWRAVWRGYRRSGGANPFPLPGPAPGEVAQVRALLRNDLPFSYLVLGGEVYILVEREHLWREACVLWSGFSDGSESDLEI